MEFNAEQKDAFDVVENTTDSLVLEAYAGTGKTTTIVEASNLIDVNLATTFVAFNKSIATELQTRLASNIRASTLHSLGLRAITYRNPKTSVDDNKCRAIYRAMNGNPEIESQVLRVVSLGKTIDSKVVDFDDLVSRFDIVIEAEYIDEAAELAHAVFQKSMNQLSVVDFDDMIYLPAIGRFPVYKSDVLFVDERQDMNRAQTALVRQALKPGGRVIAVGDMNQAIYAFRGADVEAMEELVNQFNAVRLPLSVCYRCGKKIIELAQTIVPQIKYAPNAIDGEISDIRETKLVELANNDDMILCRTNAPLVSTALKLISHGTKAQVRGRDIGKSVATLIRKVQRKYYCTDLRTFLSSLRDYTDNEISKLMAAEKMGPASALADQSETIVALAAGAHTVEEILTRIDTIFADNIGGVTLSSIHKAKGTEAKRVMILRPDLLPHPMAKTPTQRRQENNLKYVAITRAREHLMWVH